MGVITDTSTIADPGYDTVGTGVYDYKVGYHHVEREHTEIGQDPPKNPATGEYYTYDSNTNDGKGNEIYKPISNWWNGAYKALICITCWPKRDYFTCWF